MLAYLRSDAFLAFFLLALVGASARPRKIYALAPNAVMMLACARSAAFPAGALLALWGHMFDPSYQPFLALAPLAVMLVKSLHTREERLGKRERWGGRREVAEGERQRQREIRKDEGSSRDTSLDIL